MAHSFLIAHSSVGDLNTYSDDESIPHGVQVALGLAKLDGGIVAAPVLARVVQGLVDVTDKVDKETEGIAED